MDTVYFYESNKKTEVEKILATDEFMRLSYVTKISGYGKKVGYNIHLTGDMNELESLNSKLVELGAVHFVGEEKEKIIERFVEEGKNAAYGMGLIFG